MPCRPQRDIELVPQIRVGPSRYNDRGYAEHLGAVSRIGVWAASNGPRPGQCRLPRQRVTQHSAIGIRISRVHLVAAATGGRHLWRWRQCTVLGSR